MTISAQVIDTIVEWIDDNLHQPLRIDDIARHGVFEMASATAVYSIKGEHGALYSRKEAAAGRAICVTHRSAGLRYLPEVWLRFATDLYPRLHPDLQSAAGAAYRKENHSRAH